MRYLLRAILAGGLGFATSLLIAACGGGAGLLSTDQSSTLSSQLNQLSSAVSAGNCGAVSSAAAALGNSVGNLPATVNPTLRNNLVQGASTVADLAQKDCHQTTSTPTATSSSTPTPTATSTSTTTSTHPATTSTTPSSTPSTSTTPATTPAGSGTSPAGGTGGAGLVPGGAGGAGNGGAAGAGNGGNAQ
jgi:hypothetical protein